MKLLMLYDARQLNNIQTAITHGLIKSCDDLPFPLDRVEIFKLRCIILIRDVNSLGDFRRRRSAGARRANRPPRFAESSGPFASLCFRFFTWGFSLGELFRRVFAEIFAEFFRRIIADD